jgi:flagella basal body P-ring formation protein FlgA
MNKRITAFLSISFAIGLALLIAAVAHAAELRPNSTISDDVITLGDIFSDLKGEGDADTVVMRAPEPGRSLTLSTSKLVHLAKTEDIAWTPQFGDETAKIQRLSNVIGRDEVQLAVEESFALDGWGEEYEIEMASHVPPIHVAADMPAAVDVMSLDTDSRRTRFTAIVAVPAGDPTAEQMRVTGRIYRTELLPVVTRRINGGEIIRESDVALRRVRAGQIQNGTVERIDELIGMNARRPLRAESTVRRSDLAMPILIPKGSSVKMIYRNGGLLLVALGRAVEDGAAGQEMRIMNLKSKAIVVAKATGPDTVTVSQSGFIGIN